MEASFTIGIDSFLTDTRIRSCGRHTCKFNGYQSSDNVEDGRCAFKSIELDAEGSCLEYVREED